MDQGVKHNIKENASYFLTVTVEGWIDIFSRDVYRQLVVDSLRYCIKEKGLNLYAYVIMTNHLHLIVNSNEPDFLANTIRDFKKYTAKACIDEIIRGKESRREWLFELFSRFGKASNRHKNFKFWQAGNHAIQLFSPVFTWEKVNYIHQNPVRAGFVRRPQDWIYSSMSNYMERESVIPEVIRITPPVNYKR